MKWLFDSLPLIEPYPTWVKALISLWVLLTAICIIALVVTAPRPHSEASNAWLTISRVEGPRTGVRIYAHVNGNTYTYPSVGGVQWVEPSPTMAPGLFKLTPSDTYNLTFTMDAQDLPSFASQEQVVINKGELPVEGHYNLFAVNNMVRSGKVTAVVSFRLSNIPQ